MEYIEYMSNLRQAIKVVSSVLPEVIYLIEDRAISQHETDLEIALLPDEVWYNLQRQYEEVEDKLYQFNPEEEYGKVETMDKSEMRGEAL